MAPLAVPVLRDTSIAHADQHGRQHVSDAPAVAADAHACAHASFTRYDTDGASVGNGDPVHSACTDTGTRLPLVLVLVLQLSVPVSVLQLSVPVSVRQLLVSVSVRQLSVPVLVLQVSVFQLLVPVSVRQLPVPVSVPVLILTV